jgi:hypothetical protein
MRAEPFDKLRTALVEARTLQQAQGAFRTRSPRRGSTLPGVDSSPRRVSTTSVNTSGRVCNVRMLVTMSMVATSPMPVPIVWG